MCSLKAGTSKPSHGTTSDFLTSSLGLSPPTSLPQQHRCLGHRRRGIACYGVGGGQCAFRGFTRYRGGMAMIFVIPAVVQCKYMRPCGRFPSVPFNTSANHNTLQSNSWNSPLVIRDAGQGRILLHAQRSGDATRIYVCARQRECDVSG